MQNQNIFKQHKENKNAIETEIYNKAYEGMRISHVVSNSWTSITDNINGFIFKGINYDTALGGFRLEQLKGKNTMITATLADDKIKKICQLVLGVK